MARRRVQCVGASPGIAIGRVHIVAPQPTDIAQYWITDGETAGEINRLHKAVAHTVKQLRAIQSRLCRFDTQSQGEILETHILILQDELLINGSIEIMQRQAINAEWAVAKTLDHLVGTFSGIHEPYLLQRREDIEQVGRRLLWNLSGNVQGAGEHIPYPATIVVASDLTPAEVAALPRRTVKGIITARGAQTSHTAIIARSLGLPAILGAEPVLSHVREGERMIFDGDQGTLLIDPTPKELNAYRRKRTQHMRAQQELLKERQLPATTRDGHTIGIGANIELLEEVAIAKEHGAESVGMYRTEYLFLNRPDLPTEEEQFHHYREVLQRMAPAPVTIRTLDVGGDKVLGVEQRADRRNPALGLRAIRFCLREEALFRAQLRALYRASLHGKLRILIPLISGCEEVDRVQSLIADIQSELTAANEPYDPAVPLGVMIEVPAAVMIADDLAQRVDFFSIGTNDLIQYTLAVDRTDDQVEYLYQPLHPAILRMMHHTIRAARRRRIPITCCGEVATDPVALVPLLGLELDALSMNAIAIPKVKHLIRHLNFSDAKALTAAALKAHSADEVAALVRTTCKNVA
jgi:phosphoenolpyruvate-protein phosphotransferase (PTS system enzyme I)